MKLPFIDLERTRPGRLLLAMSLGLGLGACSIRKAEADISEQVEEACVAECTNIHECGTNQFYSSAEECISACTGAQRWEELNQCRSAELRLMACFAEMSCEDLEYYNVWVMSGESLIETFPCRDELFAFEDCDPNQPFEDPE